MGRESDRPMSKTQLETAYRDLVRENARLRVEKGFIGDVIHDAYMDAQEMAACKDGYARHGCAPDGNHWYRWKWSAGPFAGRYAIGGGRDLAEAIQSCWKQWRRSLDGKFQPPLDTGYRKS